MRDEGSRETVSPHLLNMMKKILITVFILCVMGTGIGYSAEKRTDVPIGNSPATGPADAPITIIEFIDFQ